MPKPKRPIRSKLLPSLLTLTPEDMAAAEEWYRGRLALRQRLANERRAAPSKVREAAYQEAERQKRHALAEEHRAKRKAAPLSRHHCRQIGPLVGWQTLLARMEPGAWYALPDLRALMPEYGRKSADVFLYQKLWPRHLVERTTDPDFEGWMVSGARTDAAARGGWVNVQPVYFWRVCAGEAARLAAEWRKQLAEGSKADQDAVCGGGEGALAADRGSEV